MREFALEQEIIGGISSEISAKAFGEESSSVLPLDQHQATRLLKPPFLIEEKNLLLWQFQKGICWEAENAAFAWKRLVVIMNVYSLFKEVLQY